MDGVAEKPKAQRTFSVERDYVVAVGGSAGGMRAIQKLLSGLPHDFAAAILLVLHLPARRGSALADLLAARSRLPVSFAGDSERIELGRVYVAPPDHHLMVQGDRMILRRGPLENNARPAVDPLMRSVGTEFGSRAIGVVVSGNLSDGSSGIMAIKRCGGSAIVQDPLEAEYPEMPNSAMATGAVDQVAPLERIAGILVGLVAEPARPSPPPPGDVVLETRIAAEQISGVELPQQIGDRSLLSCPTCQGALWQINEGELVRYRCHVGHAFTHDALDEAQISELDRALGSALRVIDERIHVLRGLAAEAHERRRANLAAQWEERVSEYVNQAVLIRQVMMGRTNRDIPPDA